MREHQDCYERTGERNRVYIDIDGKAGENMSEEEFRKKDKAIEHILLSLDLGSPHSLMKASKYNCIKGGNRMNILSYRITLMKKYGTKSSIKWYVGNKVNPKIKTALSGVINYITDEKEKTKEQQDPLSTYVDYDTTVYDKGRKMRMWNSTKDENNGKIDWVLNEYRPLILCGDATVLDTLITYIPYEIGRAHV